MSKLKANLLLLVAAAMWGFGNVWQKTVLDHLDPLSAVGIRCLIGGLLVLPLLVRESKMPKAWGFYASLARVALLFSVAITLQQIAYGGTSVTNASFLITTATVMTPPMAWLLIGERLTLAVGLAGALTLFGALLLAGSISGFGYGDLTVLLAAACYALWTVELGRHMQAYARPLTAMAAQFLGTAAFTLPLGLIEGNLSSGTALQAWQELILLGLFSTAAPYGIQTIVQRFTTASQAAVIISADSIFGGIGGAVFLGEQITLGAALGATCIFAAILYLTWSATSAQRSVQAA
ncbi:DMT family transporter [Mesorhizobium sp. B2-4-14]|uniref:DMT family transporter n=1 Tax=Mesorhizobium sp. B2-4-14 TaxID=2589935 RepID=UPI001125BA7F|nr:DMT family transporter [Mesorhizobium sp. B2-4-14]TPL06870.1 DMT family transporter [Mesorhizobium sp. B2-4-14]